MRSQSITRLLISLAIVAIVASAFAIGPVFANNGNGGSGKETVCHIPPGNPSAQHTITVGAPAVSAHLAHGDILGPCPLPYP